MGGHNRAHTVHGAQHFASMFNKLKFGKPCDLGGLGVVKSVADGVSQCDLCTAKSVAGASRKMDADASSMGRVDAADDDAASERPEVCYVCLESDGVMLVNVCACRWSRIHASCLDRLIEHDPSAVCRCCTQPFAHDKPRAAPAGTAVARLWTERPIVMRLATAAAAAEFVIGAVLFLCGVLLRGTSAISPLAVGLMGGLVCFHGVSTLFMTGHLIDGPSGRASLDRLGLASRWPSSQPPRRAASAAAVAPAATAAPAAS